MTKFGGRLTSLLTNYDITFWLLLQSALDSKPVVLPERRPCTAFPLQSVPVKPLDSRVSDTLAALNLVLIGSKIADDGLDGERFKAKAGSILFGKKVRKAEAFLRAEGFSLEKVYQLHLIQAEAPSLHSLAQPTSEALGEIFATIGALQEKPSLDTPLKEFGRSLGAFLYLWDAVNDLEDDGKNGSFNAISSVFGARPYRLPVADFLGQRLAELRSGLESLALGPEGKLCFALLESLRSRTKSTFPEPSAVPYLAPRRRLPKAGFVHTQDCGDCCCPDCGDCGECSCCECGSCCECKACDCNPCDGGNEKCCEFSCCDLGDCCGSNCCCGSNDCCSDNSGCCGSSGSDCDLFCCYSTCCDPCDSNDRYSSGRGSSPGLFERYREAKRVRSLEANNLGQSSASCPRCELSMIKLMFGEVELDECRNCGGVWCDDKEIDQLAKMISLPHNLLNRYAVEEAPARHLPGERSCPRCEKALALVPYLGISIEMCRDCHGFWVDQGLLRKILNAKRSPKHLFGSHKKEWRCSYCETVATAGSDVCKNCSAPRPKSGFTGKLG